MATAAAFERGIRKVVAECPPNGRSARVAALRRACTPSRVGEAVVASDLLDDSACLRVLFCDSCGRPAKITAGFFVDAFLRYPPPTKWMDG